MSRITLENAEYGRTFPLNGLFTLSEVQTKLGLATLSATDLFVLTGLRPIGFSAPSWRYARQDVIRVADATAAFRATCHAMMRVHYVELHIAQDKRERGTR